MEKEIVHRRKPDFGMEKPNMITKRDRSIEAHYVINGKKTKWQIKDRF